MSLEHLARRSRRPILVLYVAAIGLIAARTGDPADLTWWGLLLPFMLWIVSPVAFLCLTRPASILLPVAALALAIGSSAIYIHDMFGPSASSTSALIFIFFAGLYLDCLIDCLGTVLRGVCVEGHQ